MALTAASKQGTFASFRPSRFNSYSDSIPLRISTAGSAINEFMIELLSSIVVEFSRLMTLFRRCGRDSNSKADVKFNGNKIVTEEVLALRLLAIIVVA
jgi:hypothetical protein